MRSQKKLEREIESNRHFKKRCHSLEDELVMVKCEKEGLENTVKDLEKDILKLADVKRVNYRMTFGISVTFIILGWLLMALYFIVR